MRNLRSILVHGSLLVGIAFCLGSAAGAQVQLFSNRADFLAALQAQSLTSRQDDFESYALGDIPAGGQRGDFVYQFDSNAVQPAIVSDGVGGQALGGSPFDVFVGGDQVTLTYTPAGTATRLRAFGADFAFAPSGVDLPADLYQIRLADGAGTGDFVGNLPIDANSAANGGSFFLGLLVDPAFAFTQVSLLSVVPVDSNGTPTLLVPAYQVDNLIYAAVPEPSCAALLLIGAAALLACRRRRFSCGRCLHQ